MFDTILAGTGRQAASLMAKKTFHHLEDFLWLLAFVPGLAHVLLWKMPPEYSAPIPGRQATAGHGSNAL